MLVGRPLALPFELLERLAMLVASPSFLGGAFLLGALGFGVEALPDLLDAPGEAGPELVDLRVQRFALLVEGVALLVERRFALALADLGLDPELPSLLLQGGLHRRHAVAVLLVEALPFGCESLCLLVEASHRRGVGVGVLVGPLVELPALLVEGLPIGPGPFEVLGPEPLALGVERGALLLELRLGLFEASEALLALALERLSVLGEPLVLLLGAGAVLLLLRLELLARPRLGRPQLLLAVVELALDAAPALLELPALLREVSLGRCPVLVELRPGLGDLRAEL